MHGKQCTGTVDAWGHGAFTCRHSSRHTEHNAVRNVIQSGSRGIGFLSGKEIWVPEWQHRIDVQNIDLEEDGDLPTSIDVTIRALCGTKGRQHANPADVHAAAEKSKCKEHPVRDAHGRHVVAGQFVPFSMTTMGGIGPEAAKFLKRCAVRNPDRTLHMKDLIAAQHAYWIADRVMRALGSRVSSASVSAKGSRGRPAAQARRGNPARPSGSPSGA